MTEQTPGLVHLTEFLEERKHEAYLILRSDDRKTPEEFVREFGYGQVACASCVIVVREHGLLVLKDRGFDGPYTVGDGY